MGSIGYNATGFQSPLSGCRDDIKNSYQKGLKVVCLFVKLSEVMVQYIGDSRASMGYCGTKLFRTLKKTRMVRITHSGINESHPHDITITKNRQTIAEGRELT